MTAQPDDAINRIANDVGLLRQASDAFLRTVGRQKNECIQADLSDAGGSFQARFLEFTLEATPRVVIDGDQLAVEYVFLERTSGVAVWTMYLVSEGHPRYAARLRLGELTEDRLCDSDNNRAKVNILRRLCLAVLGSSLMRPSKEGPRPIV